MTSPNTIRLLACVLMCAALASVEVPQWVVRGVAFAESSSYYKDGKLVWVNRGRDRDSLGPFQVREIAWRQVALTGERFDTMGTDVVYAETVAKRYLVWIYEHSGKGDWELTVEKFNAGPKGRSPKYLAKVLKAAK